MRNRKICEKCSVGVAITYDCSTWTVDCNAYVLEVVFHRESPQITSVSRTFSLFFPALKSRIWKTGLKLQ